MKYKSIEKAENGKPVVVTETPRFLLKPKIRKFMAERQRTNNFWSWVELPEFDLVPDRLSFQLDTWYRIHKHSE